MRGRGRREVSMGLTGRRGGIDVVNGGFGGMISYVLLLLLCAYYNVLLDGANRT
jgi:hypothetical protein